ncbi:helix-turn-helix domain-containing protein [Dongia sp.]|uniref:helix-turn-helix domain-containing protein n=1 Tax=Dongia sp. TaxID=1977262 RepID=UPI0035B06CBC
MEIVKSAGLNVFLDTQPVARGMEWASVIAPGLWFGMVLRGHVAIRAPEAVGAISRESDWGPGATTCFWSTESFETHHRILRDGEISGVFIRVAIEDIEAIAGSDGLACLDRMDRAGVGRSLQDRSACQLAALQATAWQMLGCTLQDSARRLYLGGKAMEMMAHLLDGPRSKMVVARGDWQPREIARLHAARDILLSRLAAPPSVPELAHLVGTNARTLSEGFKDLFGMPVYAFVKARRLDEARRMLESGERSIARVAYAFGYQPAHFATEFRKRFGVAPTALTGRRH